MSRVVLWGALIFVCVAAAFVCIGLLHDLFARRRARESERVAAIASEILFGTEELAGQASTELSQVHTSVLFGALQSLTADLEGVAVERMRHLVHVLGLRKRVDALSRSPRRGRRIRAAQLVGLVPEEDPVRARLLTDASPLVRALTTEALDTNDLIEHAPLVGALLADPSHVVRVATQHAMLRGGDGIRAHLVSALEDPARVRQALTIAAHLPDPRLTPHVLEHCHSESPEERMLVAMALGNMSAGDTSSALVELLHDPEPDVRVAAATSVGRVGRIELAGQVGRLLADPGWPVRHAAGESLSRLGAVGSMVLHAYLDDEDGYARDMARRSLDVPESHLGRRPATGVDQRPPQAVA